MEQSILVVGKGIRQEIIGETLVDCIQTAYRCYRGQGVDLISLKTIGYIDGAALFIDPAYLDRESVREIINSME